MDVHNFSNIILTLFFIINLPSTGLTQESSPFLDFKVYGNSNAKLYPGEKISLFVIAKASGMGTFELDLEGIEPLEPINWDYKEIPCDGFCILSDTLTLQPSPDQCGLYVFNIVAEFHTNEKAYKSYRRVKLEIIPRINPEPAYTPGLTNDICWQSCNEVNTELIIFPIYLKGNRKQELITLTKDNVNCESIIQLKNGTRYGYFLKSFFPNGRGLIAMLSDTVFSTQDNTSPPDVYMNNFTVDLNGTIELKWVSVKDDISYISKYVVLRKNTDKINSNYAAIDTISFYPVSQITPVSYVPVKTKLKENLFIDSNIKIQTLPEELVGSTLIKTSIKDRWNQEDSFLTFNLLVPSYIYIAIDLYLKEVPDWLDEDFDFIVLKQIITDPQAQRGFMLFKSKNIFQPGKVNLGGNFANGSISPPIELMMYTVFVKPVEHILPYDSGDTVTYKDFLGLENDLNTFQYQIETIDAVGNISRGIESTPIILDLSGHCKPNITKWYNYENDSHQRFAKGQIKQVSIQNPHLIPQCSNFRATDSLRFQAVREEIVLFDLVNKVDVNGRFFDSGWLSVDDLQEPFSYKFNLLPEGKDLNFVNGKKYYYRVRAKDVFNNFSVWSDTVSAIQDVFPPGDINNLTAETEVIENIGDGCIRLNWNHAEDPVSGILKYIIYRSEDQGNSFVGVDSLPGSQNTFCDAFSNLNDNKVFYYRVGSLDGVGNIFDFRNSNWEVAIRALKGPVIRAPKSDLIECKNGLVGITNDSILVEWLEFNPDGVSGYEIHIQNPNDDIVLKTITNPLIKSSFCTLSSGDGIYQIRVRALYENGDRSIFSNTLSIRKKEQLQGVEALVAQQTNGSYGDILISWTHPDLDEIAEFQVFKWAKGENEPENPVITLPGDSLNFIQSFDKNELVAYQCNFFKVKAKDCFGLTSENDPIVSQYSNRAPVFDTAKTEIGDDFIKVCWNRPTPRVKSDDAFSALLLVYRDSISSLLVDSVKLENATCFTFENPQQHHNYLFQVKESILTDLGQSCSHSYSSHFSRTITVPFDNLPSPVNFEVQALPVHPDSATGKVFVTWQGYKHGAVNRFQVKYKTKDNSFETSYYVPNVDTLLVSNLDVLQTYEFEITAIDTINQSSILTKSTEANFNPPWVFTPKILKLNPACFRDSVRIEWAWIDSNNNILDTSLGADSILIEISMDSTFSSSKKSVSRLEIKNSHVVRRQDFPFVDEQNNVLYVHIRAKDKWQHFSPWSTVYPELGWLSGIYDEEPPEAVICNVDSVKAPVLGNSGFVNVHLSWPSAGDNCSGTRFYEIARNDSIIAIDMSNSTSHHFIDRNLKYDNDLLALNWTVHAVDGVGNRQEMSNPCTIPVILDTPDSAWCVDDSTLCWNANTSQSDLGVVYFIEGARFTSLFGNPITNINAGPLNSKCYEFNVPWDGIYWRVKARTGNFESAWSDTFFCGLIEGSLILSTLKESNYIPDKFALHQNYPNPFNPSTTIQFDVPKTVSSTIKIVIEVFNISGQRIRTLVNEMKEPGGYSVIWDSRDDKGNMVGSGLYIYRIRTEKFITSYKMLLIK